ncbi:MAG: CRISPR-associated endonuclease Cas2 [Candidatus Azambacteria bacterium]|nr:CRISPR-associated endonuclease Cas2 [Candidatus Azambacteria bacterium]
MKYLGPASRKILLLIEGGLVLSLTRRPDAYFRIVKKIAKEWKKINEQNLRKTIKRLYRSKMIDFKENSDGSVTLTLTKEGKKKILRYHLDDIFIKKPTMWDGLWRVVIFDIPEDKRQGRVALRTKLEELGFYPVQKSVFIHPYECQDEIDFILEIFELVPYVRFMRVKSIDIELDLKQKFHLN